VKYGAQAPIELLRRLRCYPLLLRQSTLNELASPNQHMTRAEITELANPENFRSFVITTNGGLRFEIKHPDYIDIPPLPEGEEQQEPSYVTVYNRAAVARFIALANIDSIEFKPARDGE
jgi:hypothetical protein